MTDIDAVKQVHRRFATGVTIVTTHEDGHPRGLVVNAFSSLSLDPPMVLVCISERAATHAKLFINDFLAVNILASAQVSLAKLFAQSGTEKFADVLWRPGRFGSPIIEEITAYFEVEIDKRVPAYTHTIFVGRVVDAGCSDRPPLVYLGGEFYDGATMQSAVGSSAEPA
jgi:flavin reductase (DIM6/NTAB) family NADH-FMN oxidoreductase RutF